MDPTRTVGVDDQGKIARLLKKFEAKEISELGNNPRDLIYATKLIEHYNELQETGGHLVKFFQPNSPLSIEHYPKHKAFFDATADYKEVLFRASNRSGKSESGGYTATSWATGIYPDWWQGRVFEKENYGWVVGRTYEDVKMVLQEKLLGAPRGTGLLPKSSILNVTVRPNSGGCADMIYIRHEPTGKVSRMKFKCYEQGAEAFQGAAPDWIWFDEEPTGKDAQLLWNQSYIRLTTTNGSFIITFTPLSGWTPMVKEFSETATDVTPEVNY